MQLSSARGLKEELRAAFGPSELRGDTGIALGVAPSPRPGEYRLAVRVRSAEVLPARIRAAIEERAAGEIDYWETGKVEPGEAPPAPADRSLVIGASIGHYRCTAGTLGFFARRLSDGAIGIVSNNHVLAIEDEAGDGDEILHPAAADRGRRPLDVVARLSGDYPRLRRKGQTADCAFARLLRQMPHNPLSLGNGDRLSPLPVEAAGETVVEKIGRTTGRTRGQITAFDLEDVNVDYRFGSAQFAGAIEIQSADPTPFSRGGDSGSLVFNTARQPVGLVYACSVLGGKFDNGRTYAHPIAAVLSSLGVTFAT